MMKNVELLCMIRKIADYQFGKGAGDILFPKEVSIILSNRTKKVRYIYLGDKLVATLKPTIGLFSLTIVGAQRLVDSMSPLRQWVKVKDDAAKFVQKGGDVFAKHVTDVDCEIRPFEEVIVLDEKFRVIAVGKAMLSGDEMKVFKKGVAVKVRKGEMEKTKNLAVS
ncbi:pseudouridine synthase [Candidatus Bathyarchaeota archaeon]|nr:pseudouridine synthase [Candidatus Bathyarchaeota archaeon]